MSSEMLRTGVVFVSAQGGHTCAKLVLLFKYYNKILLNYYTIET